MTANTITRIDRLIGINQDLGRLPQELVNGKNVIGEASGFSVWKGRDRFTKAEIGPQSALYAATWPDEHTSLIIFGYSNAGLPHGRGLQVEEQGAIINILTIGGDPDAANMNLDGLEFGNDPRNPCHMAMYSRNRYLIGATYLRNKPFYWDGNIDRQAKAIEVDDDIRPRVIAPWGGRLWGLGSEKFPLFAYYGDIDELNIKSDQWYEFKDNPLASRLIGMRAISRNYAYVWGDRGLWQLQLTGTWPLIALPQLIHGDCDCVSNGSIIHIPGVGFAWRGLENYWFMQGGMLRKINISNDQRQADRIKDRINQASLSYLHLVRGYYYKKRGLLIWCYPTNACNEQNPWQNPQSDVWSPIRDTWWFLDEGYQGMAEIIHAGDRMMVVTDEDGYLYLADNNVAYNKIETPIQWFAEFEKIGDPAMKQKWLTATLKRPFSGTDKVMVKFWSRHQAEAIEKSFSLAEDYDDASQKIWTFVSEDAGAGVTNLAVQETKLFPDTGIVNIGDRENKTYISKTAAMLVLDSGTANAVEVGDIVEIKGYDPAGPHDHGLEPTPTATSKIPVRLFGKYLKIRLSNQDGETFYNGPRIPMESLTILSKSIL